MRTDLRPIWVGFHCISQSCNLVDLKCIRPRIVLSISPRMTKQKYHIENIYIFKKFDKSIQTIMSKIYLYKTI